MIISVIVELSWWNKKAVKKPEDAISNISKDAIG